MRCSTTGFSQSISSTSPARSDSTKRKRWRWCYCWSSKSDIVEGVIFVGLEKASSRNQHQVLSSTVLSLRRVIDLRISSPQVQQQWVEAQLLWVSRIWLRSTRSCTRRRPGQTLLKTPRFSTSGNLCRSTWAGNQTATRRSRLSPLWGLRPEWGMSLSWSPVPQNRD